MSAATPLSVLTPAAPNRAAEIVEMESLMSLDAPIESKVMPRWERKKLQKLAAAGEGGASGSCAAGSAGDRFIPNRSAMHMEKAHYALSKENVGSNPQGEGAGVIDAADEAKAGAGVPTQEAATVEKKGACLGDRFWMGYPIDRLINHLFSNFTEPQSTTRRWRPPCSTARRSTACWPSARRRRYVMHL